MREIERVLVDREKRVAWIAIQVDHPGSGKDRGGRSEDALQSEDLVGHPAFPGSHEVVHGAISRGLDLEILVGGPSDEDLEVEAARYRAMHDFMGAGERRVTNKVLGLERVLGSTAAVLPGARVIHLDRDPRDTLLSIHQHPLNLTHHPWAQG